MPIKSFTHNNVPTSKSAIIGTFIHSRKIEETRNEPKSYFDFRVKFTKSLSCRRLTTWRGFTCEIRNVYHYQQEPTNSILEPKPDDFWIKCAKTLPFHRLTTWGAGSPVELETFIITTKNQPTPFLRLGNRVKQKRGNVLKSLKSESRLTTMHQFVLESALNYCVQYRGLT